VRVGAAISARVRRLGGPFVMLRIVGDVWMIRRVFWRNSQFLSDCNPQLFQKIEDGMMVRFGLDFPRINVEFNLVLDEEVAIYLDTANDHRKEMASVPRCKNRGSVR